MLTAITTTHNRPELFALLEKLITAQTVRPDQWVVVNDSDPEYLERYQYNLGQTVLVRSGPSELNGLCASWHWLLSEERVSVIKGDRVAVLEDDDWYSPDYLERLAALLEDDTPLAGFVRDSYYNLKLLEYRQLDNITHCSFAATGFTSDCLPLVHFIAALNDPFIDGRLWAGYSGSAAVWPNVKPDGSACHVGIKGLGGISPSHRDSMGGTPDPELLQLDQWIGKAEANVYLELRKRLLTGDDGQ